MCSKKLQKATISFIVSVLMEQLGSHWTDINEIWYLSILQKTFERIQVSVKSDKHNRYCTWRAIYIYIFHSVLLRKRNVSVRKFRGNQKTHCMFNNFFFFFKSCRLCDSVEKFSRARGATDDSMAHAQDLGIGMIVPWLCGLSFYFIL